MIRQIIPFSPVALMIVILSHFSGAVQAQHQGHMVLNDERMRPVQVLSASATKEWEASYTPFGDVDVQVDTINLGKSFGFAGQWFDEESGFYYNYFRDYDQELGRYIQSDPRGILLDFDDPGRIAPLISGISNSTLYMPSGLNHSYLYASNNPIVFDDPTGEFFQLIVACIANPVCNRAMITVGNALVGAVTSGILSAYSQKLNDPECPIDATKVAFAAGGGLFSGFAFGMVYGAGPTWMSFAWTIGAGVTTSTINGMEEMVSGSK